MMQGKSIIGIVDDGEFTYRELRDIVKYAKFQERQWGQNYHDVRQAEVYRLRCDKLSERVSDLTAERDALRAQVAELPGIVDQLEWCNYQCEAGSLSWNADFQRLIEIARGPFDGR